MSVRVCLLRSVAPSSQTGAAPHPTRSNPPKPSPLSLSSLLHIPRIVGIAFFRGTREHGGRVSRPGAPLPSPVARTVPEDREKTGSPREDLDTPRAMRIPSASARQRHDKPRSCRMPNERPFARQWALCCSAKGRQSAERNGRENATDRSGPELIASWKREREEEGGGIASRH